MLAEKGLRVETFTSFLPRRQWKSPTKQTEEVRVYIWTITSKLCWRSWSFPPPIFMDSVLWGQRDDGFVIKSESSCHRAWKTYRTKEELGICPHLRDRAVHRVGIVMELDCFDHSIYTVRWDPHMHPILFFFFHQLPVPTIAVFLVFRLLVFTVHAPRVRLFDVSILDIACTRLLFVAAKGHHASAPTYMDPCIFVRAGVWINMSVYNLS